MAFFLSIQGSTEADHSRVQPQSNWRKIIARSFRPRLRSKRSATLVLRRYKRIHYLSFRPRIPQYWRSQKARRSLPSVPENHTRSIMPVISSDLFAGSMRLWSSERHAGVASKTS
jgi:hypothetical protein